MSVRHTGLLHYAADNDFNRVFYYAKNSDYAETGLQLLADAGALTAFCGGRYNDWKEYRLFSRCISEQTVREEGCRRLARTLTATVSSWRIRLLQWSHLRNR